MDGYDDIHIDRVATSGERRPDLGNACVFGLCDGSGLRIDETSDTAFPCQCRSELIARRKAQRLSAVIPPRYKNVSFERPPVTEIAEMDPHVVQRTRSFTRRIDHHLDAGHGLYFVGGTPGNGKTTLAMLVSKAALAAGRSVAIYSVPRLLSVIRQSFDTPGGHLSLLDSLTEVDLLHLDDLGSEQTTPWVTEELYTIINARYEACRSIIVTTNIEDRDQLCEQLHERTVSRLEEMCDMLTLTGPDRRAYPGDDVADPHPGDLRRLEREHAEAPREHLPWR